jgi:NMD protein affecting ribosome stability and mRNA decay
MKRITLCQTCRKEHYPELKLPEELSAVYMSTGICRHCKKRTSVKRYEIKPVDEGEEEYQNHLSIY